MTTRVDYTQIAAKLDYAALEQKLEQLRKRSPEKKRKHVGDVLAPVQPKLRELHARGWTYELLAHELNAAGVPVKPGTLREYLATPRSKRGRNFRSRSTRSIRRCCARCSTTITRDCVRILRRWVICTSAGSKTKTR